MGQLAIEISKEMKLKHFIYHSVLHSLLWKMPHHKQKNHVENALVNSGLAYAIIRPAVFMQNLQMSLDATIVECNTAYGGSRANTAMRYQVAEDHGYTDIANVDIMDENGSMTLNVEGGDNLTENYVGVNFSNYDYYVILSHFKGHAMAGFGGAIKNISIGIASAEGKAHIHSGGTGGSIWAVGDSRLMEEQLHMPRPDAMLFDISDSRWHIGLEGVKKMAAAYPDTPLILWHWGSVDAPEWKEFNGDPEIVKKLIVNPERVVVLAPGESFLLKKLGSVN